MRQHIVDKGWGEKHNSEMKNIDFDIDGKKVTGVEVPLPKAPLVVAYGKDGFVMCGYLNTDAADRMNVAAAMVRGVKTVDDLLAAKVESISKAAGQKGVALGMTGKDALAKFL
jgi:uncharacterized protein YunC (DUF1805 family)